MLESLHNPYIMDVENTYVISLPNNQTSQRLTKRCTDSMDKIEQKYTVWPGFDGTSGKIIVPDHLKNESYMSWLKLIFTELTPTQVACFLSHFSLWCRCLNVDRPIVILEHDAVMIKQYKKHNLYNSIVYLGSYEQFTGSPVYATPPHASDYKGHLRSLCRAHAYAIDPAVARSLVSYTIQHGIYQSLDMFVRADLFPMAQFDLYAFNIPGESTIHKEWNDEQD